MEQPMLKSRPLGRIGLAILLLGVCFFPPLLLASDGSNGGGTFWEAVKGGPLSLVTFILGAVIVLILDKTVDFFREPIGEKIQDLLIVMKQGAAVLEGDGEMAYQLTATERTSNNALGTTTTQFSSTPTYSNGKPQATTYTLKDVVLMRWGRKAKFKGTIYGNAGTQSVWRANMTGSGTYVAMDHGPYTGTFYLQCECTNDPSFNNSQRLATADEKWAVTYVFTSVPAGGPYHFEGHWLLRSRDNNYAARFGTLTLRSANQPTRWQLIKMIILG